tara:strand:+ start:163 stop:1101 length:939 start_codon:yes stop_codon:yes gene_type:complete
MSILFYTTFSDKKIWKNKIKKYFKNIKIVSINDKKSFKKVEYAIVWNLPDNILKKLVNLKIIFSQGAGVDHILNLPSYNKTPIVRLKDPMMGDRMANHVLSQILNFQLYLPIYSRYQNKKLWLDNLEFYTPVQNNKLTVGILGVGFLGNFVGKFLKKLKYNVVGYKKNKVSKNFGFRIYYEKEINKFIKSSDIIIAILPATKETKNFIDKNFLNKMKNNSLLINVGRGITLNEIDLIKHLKSKKDFYASLDVFKKEPLSKNSEIWSLSNAIVTPHIASITVVESAVKQMFLRYKKYKKTGKIISDVDLKNGY